VTIEVYVTPFFPFVEDVTTFIRRREEFCFVLLSWRCKQ